VAPKIQPIFDKYNLCVDLIDQVRGNSSYAEQLNNAEKYRNMSSVLNFVLICMIGLPVIAGFLVVLINSELPNAKLSRNFEEWIEIYKKFN
jgi:ABC-type multidrug transport system permease subunit